MGWGLFGGTVAAWCAALCWFDVRQRRLPNALTVPAAACGVIAALTLALCGAPSALAGMGLWGGTYLVVFLLGGVGAGDVKLAPALGALVGGLAGASAVLLAVLGAQAITVAWSVVVRDRLVPHGPAMILGAVTAVVLTLNAR
ncbi:Peptidase A24A prepilin type IV OS=Tsukamurella paurometabola (strain ATCC 8368 / DSM / CCUG 35730 / CIP 100753 / JCM 10117 / KCTC 9821 / NBRC 16120 / NCIMB 702349 / NCTC 13040) OX=521096 GN=Tpau_1980 PE=3 SV=1 [Tsukamurella paurometabola]|uniref:Peptidase A24A prepilin type IV n=1 Tax=Tsukamurella paurometabola (strain ATCC 8368 / DSM 20162 / CCUG 35730 / CIP 100753 / JCM 10117 / KCTC 9821 / NBRC 16120 / NCIMB 702349 / NCTC 13040) TaxID=521096 RepID=D5UNM4_TSUPD|nr:A24 family peptidase [Tsukamurella paurometabola]ADG78592.1 peptidase A24A prepilin type IV [Tsukamurella paurometabola DSM 20162]SUP32335.1 Flp pilus assembly protein, protease CpaA [Tsukamurella paurometabola]